MKRKYTITVIRKVVETYQDTFELIADDLDDAQCKASDKLTEVIATGNADVHVSENDDYEFPDNSK